MFQAVGSQLVTLTNAWFPVAVIAALAVIGILAIIYAISPLVGRTDLRSWAKIKVYDVLFSIVLILIFFAITEFIFSIDYSSALGENLVPLTCSQITTQSSGTVPDLYLLAMCDLKTFNDNVTRAGYLGFVGGFIMGTFPSVDVKENFENPVSLPISGSYEFKTGNIILGSGAYLSYIGFLYTFYILSRVLLLLVGASMLLFSVFMSIGLIARVFPITRTFGGAMIAFGIGLGILLPLLVAINYGFINVAIQNIPLATLDTEISTIANLMTNPLASLFKDPLSFAALVFENPLTPFGSAFTEFIDIADFIGYVFAGVLLLPIFTLVIVDVFISDFSKAVGEKMDFLSILTNLI